MAAEPAATAENAALGAPYVFTPEARYEQTRSPSDNQKLTDGKYAAGHFWTSREWTVGWVQSGVIRIDLDLREPCELERVILSTARGDRAGVSFPRRIDLFSSIDGERYRYLGDMLQGADLADGPYLKRKFSSPPLRASARYLTLFITPRGDYTFLDEIEVFGKRGVTRDLEDFPLRAAQLAPTQAALAEAGRRLETLGFLRARLAAKAAIPPSAEIANLFSRGLSAERIEEELFATNAAVLGKSSSRRLVVWSTPPWENFTAVDLPLADSVEELRLDVMRRGSVSGAVSVAAGSGEPLRVRVFLDRSGVASAFPEVAIREAVPVATAAGKVLADPLVPLADGITTLRAGESRQLWLTVRGDAPPGDYQGAIRIAPVSAGEPGREIPLRITVWPATLEQSGLPAVNAWAYLSWRPVRSRPRKAVADLRDHHVSLAILHPSQLPWPKRQKSASAPDLDFRAFDEAVMLQREASHFLLYLEFSDPAYRSLGGNSAVLDGAWRQRFTAWAVCLLARMRDLGVATPRIVFYPVDEPRNGDAVGLILEVARLLRAVDPAVRVYTTIDRVERFSDRDFAALATSVDIVQLSERDLETARAGRLKKLGREVWSYNAGGGKSVHPRVYRLQAWRAFRHGATGIGFWAYADTGPSGTAWDDFDGTRPDYSVIYEGEGEIISSKRWEAWREGVEDYALLSLAKSKLRSKMEETEFWLLVERVLSHPEDYRRFQDTRRWLLDVASRQI